MLTPTMVTTEVRRIVNDVDLMAQQEAIDALWERVLTAIGEKRCQDPDACALEALTGLHYVTRVYP